MTPTPMTLADAVGIVSGRDGNMDRPVGAWSQALSVVIAAADATLAVQPPVGVVLSDAQLHDMATAVLTLYNTHTAFDPPDYIAAQQRAIIGFRLEIARMEGKWKMSQNRPAQDIDGVIEALVHSPAESDRTVAAIVNARRPSRGTA